MLEFDLTLHTRIGSVLVGVVDLDLHLSFALGRLHLLTGLARAHPAQVDRDDGSDDDHTSQQRGPPLRKPHADAERNAKHQFPSLLEECDQL